MVDRREPWRLAGLDQPRCATLVQGFLTESRPGPMKASALATAWVKRTGFDSTMFDSQSVVHRDPELLLASEIALGGLDGDMAEQGVNVFRSRSRFGMRDTDTHSLAGGNAQVDHGTKMKILELPVEFPSPDWSTPLTALESVRVYSERQAFDRQAGRDVSHPMCLGRTQRWSMSTCSAASRRNSSIALPLQARGRVRLVASLKDVTFTVRARHLVDTVT